jgi:hypothetical protein
MVHIRSCLPVCSTLYETSLLARHRRFLHCFVEPPCNHCSRLLTPSYAAIETHLLYCLIRTFQPTTCNLNYFPVQTFICTRHHPQPPYPRPQEQVQTLAFTPQRVYRPSSSMYFLGRADVVLGRFQIFSNERTLAKFQVTALLPCFTRYILT